MKRFFQALISGTFAAVCLCCEAQAACTQVAVLANVEVGAGELTLADFLGRDGCAQLREAATQVSLGAPPRAGSVRVIEGSEIRRRIEELRGANLMLDNKTSMQVPERIVVRPAGPTKSCAEIARFLMSAAPEQDGVKVRTPAQEYLHCAAARGIPENAVLELTRTSPHLATQRREFWLRCTRREDCGPFLVWSYEEKIPGPLVSGLQSNAVRRVRKTLDVDERLVMPGQTATLTWEQSGIRVVVPVTCLEAGTRGQFVRVRFKNGSQTLRAEVVGRAVLRAKL